MRLSRFVEQAILEHGTYSYSSIAFVCVPCFSINSVVAQFSVGW